MSRERCLIFCATQRTGSTMMLDDLLNIAGRWGADGEILRNALLATDPSRSFPLPNWDAAWKMAREKNRVQDLLVLKVMFHYTPYLSAAINGELPARQPPVPSFEPEQFDAFYNFFRDAIWVSVERRDVFAQAVSMYLAESTKLWEIRRDKAPLAAEPRPAPPYDRDKLMVYLRQFLAERAQWPRFFSHYNISPLRLMYEDAVDNYPGYLDEVFAATGLKRAEKLVERRLLKVGDATNEQYARLLRNDASLEPHGRSIESD
jgi:trehalose 2-sulfotransferase